MRVNIPEKNTYVDFPDDMTPQDAQMYIEANWDSIKDPKLLPYNVDLKRKSPEMQARQKVQSIMNAPPSVLTKESQAAISDVVAAQKPPKPPTFTDGVKQIFKSIGAGLAATDMALSGAPPNKDFDEAVKEGAVLGEASLALARGLVAWPVSKIVGAATMLAFQTPEVRNALSMQGYSSAGQVAKMVEEKIQQTITQAPDNEKVQAVMESAGKVLGLPFAPAIMAGEWLYENVNPTLGYAVGTTLEILTPSLIHAGIKNTVHFGQMYRYIKNDREMPSHLRAELEKIPQQEKQNYLNAIAELKKQEPTAIVEALENRGIKREIAKRFADDIADTVPVEPKPKPLPEPKVGSALDNVLIQKARDAISKRVEEKSQRGSLTIKEGEQTGNRVYEFADKESGAEIRAAQGLPKTNQWETIKDAFTKLREELTQTIEGIPHDGKHAQFEYAMIKLKKEKEIQSTNTIQMLREITEGLKPYEMDVFSLKSIFDDLRVVEGQGKQVPFGLDRAKIDAELKRLDAEIASNPVISDALARRQASWKAIVTDYKQAMKDIGFDVSGKFKNDAYFRHQIIDYAQGKGISQSSGMKTPTGRSFLRERKGSEKAFNTDYLQAEYEVMAQMLYDTQVAKVIRMVDDVYAVKVAKGGEIPEGYVEWQPRKGNVFYMTESVPERLVRDLVSGKLEEIGITADDLRSTLAVGGKRKQLVVPENIAAALDNFGQHSTGGGFANLSKDLMTAWKVWVLVSPRRWFKYNLRNMTGDADAVFVGNPSTFKKVPRATKDLYEHMMMDKPMTKELKSFMEEGGFQSTLQAQEIGDLNALKVFDGLRADKKADLNLWKKYWKAARMTTDFREGILRYSSYLDYMDQLQKNNGKPRNYGASRPEVIDALPTLEQKAFWLSNDLLGAYDRVSIAGNFFRDHIIPFWSWKEVNFKRYTQFARNAWSDGRMASAVGHKILGEAAKAPYTAYRVGSFVGKAMTLWAVLETWNRTMYPEEEATLRQEEQARPHIILGRDKDGKILYFNRMGALGDFLEWFGMDTPKKDIDDFLSGKRTLLEIAQDMGQSPVNVILQGVNPLVAIKPAFELMSRRTIFPDAFKMGIIRDRGEYLARSFGLENEYKALVGLPTRGYTQSLRGMFMYELDPGETEYGNAFDLKREYLKKIGRDTEMFIFSDKTSYLYNVKLALRYGDEDAFVKYLELYKEAGGTRKGFNTSIKHMHPLAGLKPREKREFYEFLNERDRRHVSNAIDFYERVIKGNYKDIKGGGKTK